MNSKVAIVALTVLTGLASAGVSLAQKGRWIEPRCKVLPFTKEGVFVELGDGSLIAIEDEAAKDKGLYVSKDDGRTWSEARKVYDGPKPGIPCAAGVLIKTRNGVIVWVYMDMSTMKWHWDKVKNEPRDSMRLDVWTIRSLDDGKTWVDRQKIFEGWCGTLMDIIQTQNGRIVVPVQRLLKEPGRNAVCTYVSDDDGKTWKHSNIIDLGAVSGDSHGGAMEPTLAELSDGRLLMLIRTNLHRFWEAFSEDEGLSWRVIRPSRIDASSSPGYLTRLASGRLALVWNRRYPEGKNDFHHTGGGSPTNPASWHREELSLAFSEDDGKTWTKPVVIARQPGADLAYPSIFERRPGELWITTRYQVQPPVCVSLKEKDFVGK